MSKKHALTIAFCGIDGSGKTTLAERIVAWLNGLQIPASLYKAKTGRSGIEKLGQGDLTAVVGGEGAIFMMTGIAWQSIRDSKQARRRAGSVLIYDRYTPCLLALCQLYAPDAEHKVRAVVNLLPETDLTLYVAAIPEIAAERLAQRAGGAKTLEFLRAFDQAYQSLPEAAAFAVVDGSGTPDEVFAATCALLQPHVEKVRLSSGS